MSNIPITPINSTNKYSKLTVDPPQSKCMLPDTSSSTQSQFRPQVLHTIMKDREVQSLSSFFLCMEQVVACQLD